jgi:hypothetical protein
LALVAVAISCLQCLQVTVKVLLHNDVAVSQPERLALSSADC